LTPVCGWSGFLINLLLFLLDDHFAVDRSTRGILLHRELEMVKKCQRLKKRPRENGRKSGIRHNGRVSQEKAGDSLLRLVHSIDAKPQHAGADFVSGRVVADGRWVDRHGQRQLSGLNRWKRRHIGGGVDLKALVDEIPRCCP
jgi:hypothetical protein